MTPRAKAIAFAVASVAVTGAVVLVLIVQLSYAKRITTVKDAPATQAIMVLGASVTNRGMPSDALRDRLLVGKMLYDAKKAPKIIVTGDGGSYRRDETDVMRQFLLQHGVASDDILVDPQGYRTYESCKRAKEEFRLRRILVVTQRFHLGRALYLCNELGIDSYGVSADLTTYVRGTYFLVRDLLASIVAWIDIKLLPPKPPVSDKGKTVYGMLNSVGY